MVNYNSISRAIGNVKFLMSYPLKMKYFYSLSYKMEGQLYFAEMKYVLCLVVWTLTFCCAVFTQVILLKPRRTDIT